MSRDFKMTPNLISEMQYYRGVHLLEDCEGTFLWTPSGTGGDDVHEFAAAAAFYGSKGLHMKTRATGAADGDKVILKRFIGASLCGRMVARGLVGFPDVSLVEAVRFYLTYADGSKMWQAKIAIAPNTPVGGYYNSANAFVSVAEWAVTFEDGMWSQWEIVVDTVDDKWISARWSGVEKLLPNFGLYSPGASTSRGAALYLEHETNAASPAEIYNDAIYVGEEEVL